MIHDDVALGAKYNYAPVITNSNLQFWRFTVGADNPSVNTAYYVPVVEVRIIACIILHRFECWRWWPKMIDLICRHILSNTPSSATRSHGR